jgi:pimeloyl-ACP methyl ester carboxylesterase
VAQSLPLVLVPGLLCSARVYLPQIASLWPLGPVTVADHRRDDTMAAIAARILADAPPRFALAGLSMGGYIAFAMMRQAPQRFAKLALLDTSARPDMPEQIAEREKFISMSEAGQFADVAAVLTLRYSHRNRHNDETLKGIIRDMAAENGTETFVRHLRAIMSRADSRPLLAAIRCPTLVLVGDGDELLPPALATENAAGIPGARLVIVPDCGHLCTLEKPEPVNAALAEWLEA